MKTVLRTVAAMAIVAGVLAAQQPTLRADNPVVNTASYSPSVAQGAIFAIFGTNLAGDTLVTSPPPYPLTLGGVSIKFTPASGGTAVDARMIYTTKGQVGGLLPSTAAPGTYNVTVTYNSQTSAPGKATVVANTYGIVTADASGSGMAQGQIYDTARNLSAALTRFATGSYGPYLTSPAYPGSTVVLWGSGLGADASSDVLGNATSDFKSITQVTVGSKTVAPVYAGRGPTLPGADVVYFVVPADVETGCNVPVSVKVANTLSNVATIAIATAGKTICDDPFLSPDILQKISANGSITMGAFKLSKQTVSVALPLNLGTQDVATETASGSFGKFTFGSLLSAVGGVGVPAGTCQVYTTTGSASSVLTVVPVATLLDAGSQLTLNGPNATNLAIPRQSDKSYSQTLYTGGSSLVPSTGTPVIAAGTYTLAGTGGVDVGAFQAQVAVPTPLVWANAASITSVNRSQGLTVIWSGGGSGLVVVVGASGSELDGSSSVSSDAVYQVTVFLCIANASAGTFTVPSSILSQLPATDGNLLNGNLGLLGLTTAGNGSTGKFTAPLKAGGNIDYGLFNYSIGSDKTVAYQ